MLSIFTRGFFVATLTAQIYKDFVMYSESRYYYQTLYLTFRQLMDITVQVST